MDIIHGYIYSTNREETTPPPRRFYSRHLRGITITLSVILHLSLFAWIFYQGVIAPFTNMELVDADYDVKWIEIKKMIEPLKYPPSMLPNPGSSAPNNLESSEVKPEKKKKEKKKEEIKEEEEKPEEETA